jgi:hypothetical protein
LPLVLASGVNQIKIKALAKFMKSSKSLIALAKVRWKRKSS